MNLENDFERFVTVAKISLYLINILFYKNA